MRYPSAGISLFPLFLSTLFYALLFKRQGKEASSVMLEAPSALSRFNAGAGLGFELLACLIAPAHLH